MRNYMTNCLLACAFLVPYALDAQTVTFAGESSFSAEIVSGNGEFLWQIFEPTEDIFSSGDGFSTADATDTVSPTGLAVGDMFGLDTLVSGSATDGDSDGFAEAAGLLSVTNTGATAVDYLIEVDWSVFVETVGSNPGDGNAISSFSVLQDFDLIFDVNVESFVTTTGSTDDDFGTLSLQFTLDAGETTEFDFLNDSSGFALGGGVTVPEPSSTLLLAVFGVALGTRPKR